MLAPLSSPPLPASKQPQYATELRFADTHTAILSEVVDVFTAVPKEQNGFSSRVQSVDQLHIAKSSKGPEVKDDDEREEGGEPEISFTESEPALPQEMAYKSIRKSPRRLVSTKSDQDDDR